MTMRLIWRCMENLVKAYQKKEKSACRQRGKIQGCIRQGCGPHMCSSGQRSHEETDQKACMAADSCAKGSAVCRCEPRNRCSPGLGFHTDSPLADQGPLSY